MEERVFYQGPTHPILHMHRAFTGITLPLCSQSPDCLFFFKRKIKRKFLKVILTWITTLAIRLACEKYGWRIAGGRFRWNALDTNSITKICITSTKLTHFSNTKKSGCYSSRKYTTKNDTSEKLQLLREWTQTLFTQVHVLFFRVQIKSIMSCQVNLYSKCRADQRLPHRTRLTL